MELWISHPKSGYHGIARDTKVLGSPCWDLERSILDRIRDCHSDNKSDKAEDSLEIRRDTIFLENTQKMFLIFSLSSSKSNHLLPSYIMSPDDESPHPNLQLVYLLNSPLQIKAQICYHHFHKASRNISPSPTACSQFFCNAFLQKILGNTGLS